MKNYLKNDTDQLLENLRKGNYTYRQYWATELADMQSISKFNKEIRFLYWVINMYRKYRWVILLRDKKELQLIMLFKKN